MTDSGTPKPWNKIYLNMDVMGDQVHQRACAVLAQHRFLLPKKGRALDLACGLGYNALLLAKQGLTVDAWDTAEAAVTKLQSTAARLGLEHRINAQVRDVIAQPPETCHYDVITVSHFLHRELCPAIQDALHPDGLLFYQTFHSGKDPDQGPKNPDFILENNELLRLFPDLSVLFYQEFANQGQLDKGDRQTALLVAQRRSK